MLIFMCHSNIYNLFMYKHETIRNRLIRYLNLETSDRLTGYLVKVHSTTLYKLCITLKHIKQMVTTDWKYDVICPIETQFQIIIFVNKIQKVYF